MAVPKGQVGRKPPLGGRCANPQGPRYVVRFFSLSALDPLEHRNFFEAHHSRAGFCNSFICTANDFCHCSTSAAEDCKVFCHSSISAAEGCNVFCNCSTSAAEDCKVFCHSVINAAVGCKVFHHCSTSAAEGCKVFCHSAISGAEGWKAFCHSAISATEGWNAFCQSAITRQKAAKPFGLVSATPLVAIMGLLVRPSLARPRKVVPPRRKKASGRNTVEVEGAASYCGSENRISHFRVPLKGITVGGLQ
jgi:hypothetical protein